MMPEVDYVDSDLTEWIVWQQGVKCGNAGCETATGQSEFGPTFVVGEQLFFVEGHF